MKTKRRRIRLYLIVLLIFSKGLIAQEKVQFIELFSATSGISDVVVNDLITDNDGLLWVGTDNGLNCYVNQRFELYHEYSNDHAQVGHTVSCLFVDSKGRIWVGDRLKGLSIIDPISNSTTQIPSTGPKKIIDGREIIRIKEANDGTFWLLVFPDQFIHMTDDFDIIDNPHFKLERPIFDSDQIPSFEIMENGNLIFPSMWDSIQVYDTVSKKFHVLAGQSSLSHTPGFENYIHKVGVNLFFLELANSMYLYNSVSGQFKAIDVPKGHVYNPCTVVKNGPDDFWLLKYPDIRHYNINGELIESFRVELPRSMQYLEFHPKRSWIDHSRIVWFGTDQGILKIDLKHQQFKLANRTHSADSFVLSGSYARTVYSTGPNHITFGFVDGTHYDEMSIKPSLDGSPEYQVEHIPLYRDEDKNIHPSSRSNAIYTSQKWGTLIATYSGLFHKKPGGKGAYLLEQADEYSSICSKKIWSFYPIDDDHIITGTFYFGFHKLNLKTMKYEEFETSVLDEQWDMSTGICDIKKDRLNRIWVLTSNGLYKVLELTNKRILLQHVKVIEKNSVWALTEGPNGEIWVGTIEDGIFVLSNQNELIEHIDYKKGLPSMIVCSMIADWDGLIWASSPNSIYALDAKTKNVVKKYDYTDGLFSGGLNYRTAARDSLGQLYFGTKNGIIHFNPKALIKSSYAFKSRIKILSINGKKYPNHPDSIQIHLPANDRSLFIETFLNDYSNPKLNSIIYYLEGIDKNTSEIRSKTPEIRYPNLEPGNYTLVIKGVNSQGGITANTIRVPVVVSAFIWETNVFKFSIGLIALIILIMTVKLILKNSKNENLVLESQIDSLRSQMNPHFFFNALNSIQDFIFQKDREKAANYMSGFAKLLRAILDTSSRRYISLCEEEGLLTQYLELEALRFEGLMKWEIHIDASIPKTSTYIPTMLIQPIIENAIKHGLSPKKTDMQLVIRFLLDNGRLLCEVEDNGVGRKSVVRDENHISRGLEIIKKRIKLLNVKNKKSYQIKIIDLVDQNEQPNGTKVCLILN